MADRSGYIGRNPGDSSVVIARQTFEPTGIQTDFTFASGYTPGYLDVYINGVRLVVASDYTATDGSVVGLTTHAGNGDVLECVAYKAFNVNNVDSTPGNFTVGGDLIVDGILNIAGAGSSVSYATTSFGLEGSPPISVNTINASGVVDTDIYFRRQISGDNPNNVYLGYSPIGLLGYNFLTKDVGGNLVAGIATNGSAKFASGNCDIDTNGTLMTKGSVQLDSGGNFGSPKIELIGSSGDATFYGQINSGDGYASISNTGTWIQPGGGAYTRRPAGSTDPVFQGGVVGAIDNVNILASGDATFAGDLNVSGISTLGITSVSKFTAKGTLIEGMSSTTTAYSSSSDLNITNGNYHFSSANLGGTNNTLNIMSTTGINTDLTTNQVMNVTAVTSVNATTAYINRVSIDGLMTGITTHWVGGSEPSAGGGSGLDTYSFNVMKTGNETYIVIANQVKTS